jgi:glucokinase
MDAFLDCPNETIRGILAAIPVYLVMDPDVALIGAANACRYLCCQGD